MDCYLLAAQKEVDFMIHGVFSYELFGQTLWITTTHICLLIVILALIGFAVVVNINVRKADPRKASTGIVNVAELMVEMLDGMVKNTMGEKYYRPFANYINTIFCFILLSNISGIFGLRPPTADFGVTFPLALISFTVIHFQEFKNKKLKGVLAGLCDPWPFWAPINLIGIIAVPISLSLRLLANVLSGTAIMALIYTLLNKFAIIWPAALHVYFDLFSGAIQTYVFCMLTMTYITDTFGDE